MMGPNLGIETKYVRWNQNVMWSMKAALQPNNNQINPK